MDTKHLFDKDRHLLISLQDMVGEVVLEGDPSTRTYLLHYDFPGHRLSIRYYIKTKETKVVLGGKTYRASFTHRVLVPELDLLRHAASLSRSRFDATSRYDLETLREDVRNAFILRHRFRQNDEPADLDHIVNFQPEIAFFEEDLGIDEICRRLNVE